MKFWVGGFLRDSHPSSEVAIWERIASVYCEYVKMARGLKPKQHEQVFR
jgi:hypothetical protein